MLVMNATAFGPHGFCARLPAKKHLPVRGAVIAPNGNPTPQRGGTTAKRASIRKARAREGRWGRTWKREKLTRRLALARWEPEHYFRVESAAPRMALLKPVLRGVAMRTQRNRADRILKRQ